MFSKRCSMIPQKQGREPFRLATSTMAPTPLHNLWAPQWPSMLRNSRKSFPLFVFARLGQKIVQKGWAETMALFGNRADNIRGGRDFTCSQTAPVESTSGHVKNEGCFVLLTKPLCTLQVFLSDIFFVTLPSMSKQHCSASPLFSWPACRVVASFGLLM